MHLPAGRCRNSWYRNARGTARMYERLYAACLPPLRWFTCAKGETACGDFPACTWLWMRFCGYRKRVNVQFVKEKREFAGLRLGKFPWILQTSQKGSQIHMKLAGFQNLRTPLNVNLQGFGLKPTLQVFICFQIPVQNGYFVQLGVYPQNLLPSKMSL